MSDNNFCEGCTFNDSTCSDWNQDGDCPCTECIVKAMCRGICEEFDAWDTNGGYIIQKNRIKHYVEIDNDQEETM